MRIYDSIILLLSLALGLLTQISVTTAVEIAYEGFGYSSGYFGIADGGDNTLDPRHANATFDGLDDGICKTYDHDDNPKTPKVQPTKLGDRGHAGGSGAWTTAWTKRGRNVPLVNQIDGSSTLSYTDRKGNRLATMMGKPVLFQNYQHTWRTFDASGLLDGKLTMPNLRSPSKKYGSYPVPTLGKQGTVVWLSFLADLQVETQNEEQNGEGEPRKGHLELQFWNKRHNRTGGEVPPDRTAGLIRKTNSDWDFWDSDWKLLKERFLEPVGGTNTGSLAGSREANERAPLWIVAKIDYGATTTTEEGKPVDDGYADVTLWYNPALDAEPSPSSASRKASAFIPFNGINIYYWGSPHSTSSIDEIRIGTTYKDVAPIVGR